MLHEVITLFQGIPNVCCSLKLDLKICYFSVWSGLGQMIKTLPRRTLIDTSSLIWCHLWSEYFIKILWYCNNFWLGNLSSESIHKSSLNIESWYFSKMVRIGHRNPLSVGWTIYSFDICISCLSVFHTLCFRWCCYDNHKWYRLFLCCIFSSYVSTSSD